MARADVEADDLRRWLSNERVRAYEVACADDPDLVVPLYQWNAAVAGAFFEELGHFEVLLRNAMHKELTVWHSRLKRSDEWYDDPEKALDDRRRSDILAARQRIAQKGAVETPGKVVAELNLGFWRFLLDQRHQQVLWAQALHRAFPGMPKRRRSEVQRRVNRLHRLRNRIAHHEPIHHEDLETMRRDLVQVVRWIDEGAASWLTSTCVRAKWLLEHRP